MSDPAALVASLNHSISIVSRLREISKNVRESEIRNLLADLSNELADAKLKVATLKEDIARLVEENGALKRAKPENKEKPTVMWGCYQFEGDTGLYCTACYDSRGAKSLTNRATARFRMCPVCKATIGTS